jgi:hypothetical protein
LKLSGRINIMKSGAISRVGCQQASNVWEYLFQSSGNDIMGHWENNHFTTDGRPIRRLGVGLSPVFMARSWLQSRLLQFCHGVSSL